MDFSLFAHMERLDASQRSDDLYENFVSLCQMADDGGMRAIWTGEHHGMDLPSRQIHSRLLPILHTVQKT